MFPEVHPYQNPVYFRCFPRRSLFPKNLLYSLKVLTRPDGRTSRFSLHKRVQMDCWAHRTFCSLIYGFASSGANNSSYLVLGIWRSGFIQITSLCNFMVFWYWYWYWHICELQLGSHPVAVVQQTFTHKRYTERHNETEYLERNIHKNKNSYK
jgi:hypothetical protein